MPLPTALVLGHDLIDAQHDHLLDLIARLQGCSRPDGAIADMVSFMRQHFRDEEEAIALRDQEVALDHGATHRVIAMQVLDIVAGMQAGGCPDRASRSISAILLEHIVTEDRMLKRLFSLPEPRHLTLPRGTE
ncbi:MAG TPA: hemerythrin domain-containing protein [Magnetospirillum sp.]|jgi:hemerythrin-like metal-binding protein|nr:hemerythrin domain-containing protein [Magnetospirillum sp.]